MSREALGPIGNVLLLSRQEPRVGLNLSCSGEDDEERVDPRDGSKAKSRRPEE